MIRRWPVLPTDRGNETDGGLDQKPSIGPLYMEGVTRRTGARIRSLPSDRWVQGDGTRGLGQRVVRRTVRVGPGTDTTLPG